MISDDESAFLKSITGTLPIKKNNKLKKEMPLTKAVKKDKEVWFGWSLTWVSC